MSQLLQHHPCDPRWPVSQTFGENPDWYTQFNLLGHNGVDFALPVGQPIYAMTSGRVVEARDDPKGYGLFVKVETSFGNWLVAHLSQFRVSVGQQVGPGTVVGLSGNSGNSTGPHVHVGLRVAPYGLQDGFNGYSDPLPYIEQIGKRLGALIGAHVIGPAQPYLSQLRRLEPRMALFLDPNKGDVQAFRAASPSTTVIGRIYVPDSEVADRIRSNPTAAAAWAHQLVMNHEARSLCDYWQIANEVLQTNWEEFQKLVTFERERMRLADQAGYKCGILAFSVGQPDLPENDRAAFWRATYPALEVAQARGHALVIHQYGCCPSIWGPANRGGSDWLLHRFEHQVRLFLPYKTLKVFVTEFGYDGLIMVPGYRILFRDIRPGPVPPLTLPDESAPLAGAAKPPGYKTAQTPEAYAKDLLNVQEYLERFSGQIKGYTIFQLGDNATWENYNIAGPVLEALAKAQEEKPVPEPDQELYDVLTVQAQLNQLIEFNPDAALQKRIFADGFVPNSPEFSFTSGDISYIGQRAERLSDGEVRAYYVPVGQWDQVDFITYDPSTVVLPPEPPEPPPDSDLEQRMAWAEARLAALETIHP